MCLIEAILAIIVMVVVVSVVVYLILLLGGVMLFVFGMLIVLAVLGALLC